jgi:hypothetical protein
MSDSDVTILRCPECDSTRAGIIASVPPKAKCVDCGHIYSIATLPDPANGNAKKPKKGRTAAPGVRHRRDNGPQELQVDPVPAPTPKELGTLHLHTENIIGSGAQALLKSHRRAAKLAHMYGEEFIAEWRLKTKWLEQLESSSVSYLSDPSDIPNMSHSSYSMGARNRACVRYAMMWRPTFLAVVALSYELLIGCKAAGVSHMTVARQRKADPDFDAQVIAAQAHCISLLHAMSLRSAIEGESEPVFWQGIRVGYIKKFDNRLRIELLRAHLPAKFKTPGSGQAPLIAGDNNKVVVIDAARRAQLVALRTQAVEPIRQKRIRPPNGRILLLGNSSAGVQ